MSDLTTVARTSAIPATEGRRSRRCSTLASVYRSKPLQQFKNPRTGKFTQRDSGLISTIVSVMQDHAGDEKTAHLIAMHAHVHEACKGSAKVAESLGSALKRAFRMGWKSSLLDIKDPTKKGPWAFLTLENLVKGGGIVCVAIALIFTTTMTNYREQNKELQISLTAARSEAARETQRYDEMQASLRERTQQLLDLAGKKAAEGDGAFQQCQVMLAKEMDANTLLRDQNADLNDELTKLKAENDSLKKPRAAPQAYYSAPIAGPKAAPPCYPR